MPVLATCGLAAGVGVGVLWGASRIGDTRDSAPATPIVVQRPADQPPIPVAAVVERPLAIQPAVAQALAASDEAFQLVSPPQLVLVDPFEVARARANDEAPFMATPVPAPARAPSTAVAPPPSRPAVPDVTGRMAKIAPSSDGLPARVRAKPNTSADVVARVPIGAQLRVLGPADGAKDWLRVTVNGVTGYVRSDLIR
jgi:hypothetical protein